jgi:hypothetical protein
MQLLQVYLSCANRRAGKTPPEIKPRDDSAVKSSVETEPYPNIGRLR